MGKFDDDYEEIEEEEERNIDNGTILLLDFIATWFIRIGLVLAFIALVYYIVTGQVFSAFMYIIGLVIAYFFGYFFMFCLDKIFDNK